MQKYLGHHSILTTVRYTHLTDQTKHRAIERINDLMDGFNITWGQPKEKPVKGVQINVEQPEEEQSK